MVLVVGVGVGGPRSAPRGSEPLAPRSPRPTAAAPRPPWPRRRKRSETQSAERRAGMRQKAKLGSGLFRFTGLAARLSARAHEWLGERGPAARIRAAERGAALRSQGPSPRRGPG